MALAKDLEKLPLDEARAKTKLSGDEAAVKKAHDAMREAELKVKKIELDAQTRRTTIQRLKQQQFETRKNDEFQAIAHEITRYERELDAMETSELEAMEEVDSFRTALRKAEAGLAHTKGLVEQDLASIAQRKARMEEEKTEVVAERDRLAELAPQEMLPLYHRLMKIKDGMAIAPMSEGKCQGCHMKLIASTVVRVQSAKEITQCEDCGRILYMAD